MSDLQREGASDVRGADVQGVLSTQRVSSVPSCRASAKCGEADPRSSLTSDKTRPVRTLVTDSFPASHLACFRRWRGPTGVNIRSQEAGGGALWT